MLFNIIQLKPGLLRRKWRAMTH